MDIAFRLKYQGKLDTKLYGKPYGRPKVHYTPTAMVGEKGQFEKSDF